MKPPANQPQTPADDSASDRGRDRGLKSPRSEDFPSSGAAQSPTTSNQARPPGVAAPDDPTASGEGVEVFSLPGDANHRGPVAPVPAFDAPTEAMLSEDVVDEANPGAQTVISKRPVAAPEEFYRSMPLAELAEMLEGRQLDHFAVEQMIGGGGMGAVFRGRDLRLDRVVAIKVIPASRRDADTLRRFRQEAQAAARLDHPNIARVYYVGEADRWNYIVFEFIDGVNIRDLVQMEGPLSIDDAVFYCRQVAEALEHARTRDVVHRDIKPSNILVTATGHVEVVDMGLARDTSIERSRGDETASGITLGTFDYISPEQARNPRDADTRSDLYSLGCSLFFMLTGTPPFPDGTALQKLLNHGSQPPPDPRAWREDVSDQLNDVLLRLMAKRPSQRYQKPIDLVNDLVLLAEAEGLPRSQSPGAYMFTPTVVQRSLLEANLPWIVAFAFLMGSTLWLQSMQATSGMNQLPRITNVVAASPKSPDSGAVPATSASRDSAAGTFDQPGRSANEPRKESDAVIGGGQLDPSGPGEPTALPSEVLVVAAQQPGDVAPMQWEKSLDQALLRVSESESLREIEIRGAAEITQSMPLIGRSLTIRGQRGAPALLGQVRVAMSATTDANPSVFQIDEGVIRFESLKLVVELEDLPSRRGLVGLAGVDARLVIRDCEIDAMGAATSGSNRFAFPAFSLVQIGEDERNVIGPFLPSYSGAAAVRPVQGPVGPLSEQFGPSSQPTGPRVLRGASMPPFSGVPPLASVPSNSVVASAGGDNRRRVEVIGSVLRLHGGLVALEDLQGREKLELVIRSSLLVTGREVLFARASNGEGNPRFVRAELESSTLMSPTGFATFTYEGNGNPQLGLNRQSSSCAYWSSTGVGHLTLVGARRQSLLGNFVLLDFQGQANAYDRAIEELCQSYSGSTLTAKFGFQEAGTDGWFAERGSEYQVTWPNEPSSINFDSPTEISEITRQTVAIENDMFEPGVKPLGRVMQPPAGGR